MSFKNSLKNNIITPYNKYNLSQEKIAEVLSVDKKKKTCIISYINIDGIKIIKGEIPLEMGFFKSIAGDIPDVGDYVQISEVGRTIRIVNIVDADAVKAEQETGDVYSGSSSFSGNLGV